jgi:hypothetical protein
MPRATQAVQPANAPGAREDWPLERRARPGVGSNQHVHVLGSAWMTVKCDCMATDEYKLCPPHLPAPAADRENPPGARSRAVAWHESHRHVVAGVPRSFSSRQGPTFPCELLHKRYGGEPGHRCRILLNPPMGGAIEGHRPATLGSPQFAVKVIHGLEAITRPPVSCIYNLLIRRWIIIDLRHANATANAWPRPQSHGGHTVPLCVRSEPRCRRTNCNPRLPVPDGGKTIKGALPINAAYDGVRM